MKLTNKKFLADAALLVSALIWGGDYIAVKLSLEELTPLYLSGLRFASAFVIMLLVFWKRMRRTGRKELIGGLVVGISMFVAFAFQTIGMQYTTAGKSAFITSVYAIILPFIVWIAYRRFPGWHIMLGALVCVLGVALLSINDLTGINMGDFLTIFCALFFAVNIFFVAHYVRSVDPVILTVIETGVTGVCCLAGAFIFERPLPAIGRTSLLGLVYLCTLGTIGTHLLSNIALKHRPSVHAGIIFTTESVFTVIFAYFLLGELLAGRMVVGCALIFTAILIAEIGGPVVKKIKSRFGSRPTSGGPPG